MKSLVMWSTAHTDNCVYFEVVEDDMGTGQFIALETTDGTPIYLPERTKFELTWDPK